jgi:exosortase/archaeosortase family protein
MFKKPSSPEYITYFLVGMSLIPRLTTSYALKVGTIYIILFWLPLFVLLPEFVKGYESKNKPLIKFPKISLCILSTAFLITIASLLFRNDIYKEESELLMEYIRRGLYFLHPFVCVAWYPFVKVDKRIKFLTLLFFLTALMGGSILSVDLFSNTQIVDYLNKLTANFAALLITPFSEENINITGQFFGNSNFMIEVREGCSPIKQTTLALNSIIIFYLCCKINSIIKIVVIVFAAVIGSFVFNSIRIAILAKIVSNNKMEFFHFWHSGPGSLIFSFIIMFCSSAIYYYVWSKEIGEDKVTKV